MSISSIIVEDGQGIADATSYVSMEEAHAYLVPRNLWPAAPVAVPDPEQPDAEPTAPEDPQAPAKSAALIRAFDWLNSLEWLGQPTDWQQMAAWPRLDVPTPGSRPENPSYIAANVIPMQVKRAQMELAGLIYSGTYNPMTPQERGGKIISQSESRTETVDVISTSESRSVTYDDDAPLESWLPSVYPILRGLLATIPGEDRGGFVMVSVQRG